MKTEERCGVSLSFTAIINIIDLYSKVSPLESVRYGGEDISHLSLTGGVEDVAHTTFKIIFIKSIISASPTYL